MKYQVSIIIPIYNVQDYVAESILSALNQSFNDIEFILVNDCTKDNSMKIVKDIIVQHPRRQDVYIYEHIQNQGLSAARNTGLSKATGEYIFFLDSDDEISPECIEKHFEAINKEQSDFTIANIKLIGANSKSIHLKEILENYTDVTPLNTFFQRKLNVSPCNKLYLHSFLLRNNLIFKDGLLYEDIFWSYNVCLYAKKVSFINETTYRYIVRPDSITTKKSNSKKIESLLFVLKRISDDWKNGLIPDEYFHNLCKFIDFYKFTLALQLLKYAGSMTEQKLYYQQIRNIFNKPFHINVFLLSLKLPFILFFLFFSPIYFFYKKIS